MRECTSDFDRRLLVRHTDLIWPVPRFVDRPARRDRDGHTSDLRRDCPFSEYCRLLTAALHSAHGRSGTLKPEHAIVSNPLALKHSLSA
jgi:hypothetical protein